jgi:hypothetical protein
MHCWCPPATGPGQPHEKNCVMYQRPIPKTVQATIGSWKDWPLETVGYWATGIDLAYLSPVPLPPPEPPIGFIKEAQAYNQTYQWMVNHEVKPNVVVALI